MSRVWKEIAMQDHGSAAGAVAVGVDASTSSGQALDFAIDQALVESRPLALVHAVGGVGAQRPDGSRTGEGGINGGDVDPESWRVLVSAGQSVAQRAPDLEVRKLLPVGDPRDALLAVATEAALVVVGSRGRGPRRSRLMGSVGVVVSRHAACPVVIVRPGNRGLVRRGVLVGADGTERSRSVLDFAFRQASMRDLPLTVLHTFWDAHLTVTAPVGTSIPGDDLEEQRLLLAECVAGLRADYPDVPVRTEVARGLPDQSLISLGRSMHLIVVGSHRDGAAFEVLFGSVTARVVERATCAVAVVPSGAGP